MSSDILGLLDNTLNPNYKYPRSSRENLPLPIQIKLSKKPERIFQVSFLFFFIFGVRIKIAMF